MPTFREENLSATVILYCTLKNPANASAIEDVNSLTECQIHTVLKSHPLVAKNKVITLNQLISGDFTGKRFIVFFDVHKNKLDAYRGIEVRSPEVVKYFKSVQALTSKDPNQALAFFFQHLGHKDSEIGLDTYNELSQTCYEDLRKGAKNFEAEKLLKWLQDPQTQDYRHGLYAMLLGLCGKPEHAKALRTLIDDPVKSKGSGLASMLAAYVVLQPKEAWAYLTGVLKTSKDFGQRFAILQTCRFLYDERPDLIGKKDVVQAVALLLKHRDMADFAIEDLRQWKRWEMTDRVLDLAEKPSHDLGSIKRAMLRFALRNPTMRAGAFVAQQRMRDSEWVQDNDDLLDLEDPREASPKNKEAGQTR